MNKQELKQNNGWIGGLILIAIGVVVLLTQLTDFNVDIFQRFDGALIIPLIGGIFLLAGIVTRNASFIIPGGIISGAGWGATVVTGAITVPFFAGWDEGSIFMLTFAAGWAAITLLTAIFTDKTHWWALIPGSIIALIGLAVEYGGAFATMVTTVGKLWPILLILGGISIVADQYKKVK